MANQRTVRLATNQTTNATGNPQSWNGAIGNFCVEGTLDGATVKLEVKPENLSDFQEFDSSNTTLTAIGVVAVTAGRGQYRVDITGGSESTQDISAVMTPAERQ